MATDFVQLAKAVGQKATLDTEQQLAEIEQQKNAVNQKFNMSIADMKLQLSEQKNVDNKIKFEEKRSKLRANLLKDVLTAQGSGVGPVAVGGDLLEGFAPATEQGAENLPLIDMQSQRQV